MYNALVISPLHPSAIDHLHSLYMVHYEINPNPDRLKELIVDADIVILRSGVQLDHETILAGKRLKVIARAGSGIDNINLKTALAQGIRVFNIPAESAKAVAELGLGLMISLYRHVGKADRQLRRNEWRKKELMGREISGKVLGLVGLGSIGKNMARLGNLMGMKVIATPRNIYPERVKKELLNNVVMVPFEELIAQSDVLCLAVPLTASTKNMINAAVFDRMKPGALLINLARAEVVNSDALQHALRTEQISGAALDVFEWKNASTPFDVFENVILTPHLGAMTEESQIRIGNLVVSGIESALRNETIPNEFFLEPVPNGLHHKLSS